jgi:hypothetical protein
MCGRLIGRLLGTVRRREERSAYGREAAFFAYRPLAPVGPIVPFRPTLRFQCEACGGAGAIDDVEVFSTVDDVSDPVVDNESRQRGPGRPRRTFAAARSDGVQRALEIL